jgi:hypothetical protein
MLVPLLGKVVKERDAERVLTAIVELFFLLFCSGECRIIMRT